jgi:hypothetical protein
MLPRPGCDEILPARSRVSEELGSIEVPGGGSVDERASIGRRGERREMVRCWEGREDLRVG